MSSTTSMFPGLLSVMGVPAKALDGSQLERCERQSNYLQLR